MLRPTDVLVGNNGFCQEHEGTVAYHRQWKELYNHHNDKGRKGMPSDEVLTEFIKSLMKKGPAQVRFMEPYKDTPNGEELWGSTGGFDEVFRRLKHLMGDHDRKAKAEK
jgi:hypothetical protein